MHRGGARGIFVGVGQKVVIFWANLEDAKLAIAFFLAGWILIIFHMILT